MNTPSDRSTQTDDQWLLEEIEDRIPTFGVVVITIKEREFLCQLVRKQLQTQGKTITRTNL